jgi:hypothetical protein
MPGMAKWWLIGRLVIRAEALKTLLFLILKESCIDARTPSVKRQLFFPVNDNYKSP